MGLEQLDLFQGFEARSIYRSGSISTPPGSKCKSIRHLRNKTESKLGRVNVRKDFWDCYWID